MFWLALLSFYCKNPLPLQSSLSLRTCDISILLRLSSWNTFAGAVYRCKLKLNYYIKTKNRRLLNVFLRLFPEIVFKNFFKK
jgi:hypothetical protein